MNSQPQYTDWDGRPFYYAQGKRVYLDGGKDIGTEARELTDEDRKEMAERQAAAEQEPAWRRGMAFKEITFDFEGDCGEATMERIIFRGCSVKVWFDLDGEFYESDDEESDSPGPVELSVYSATTGETLPSHAAAFEHFVQNASVYEKRLQKHMTSKMRDIVSSGVRANDTAELHAFVKRHALTQQRALKKVISWVGVSVSDSAHDTSGFISFDFECGWDEEHGFSVLMHMGKVVAESEMSAFACGGDALLEVAREHQESTRGYDLELT